MREAIDQVLSYTIDWDAVARAVRTLTSAEEEPEEPTGVPSGPTMTAGNKKSATFTSHVNNRLSDFENFDWD